MTLEDSQESMINHMIKKLDINDKDTVLDIGSGFGGLACAIAEKTGARVDGITLSKVQLDFSQKIAREKKIRQSMSISHRRLSRYEKKILQGNFEGNARACNSEIL